MVIKGGRVEPDFHMIIKGGTRLSIMHFILPFLFSLLITSVGISVIYFAIKIYCKNAIKTFNTFIASFVLFVTGLCVFVYGLEGFWWLFTY